MNKAKRPTALMTAGQLICAAAMLFTTVVTILAVFFPGSLSGVRPETTYQFTAAGYAQAILQAVGALGVGCCLLLIEAEALLVCGRMKKASAFSAVNVKSLGRIVCALVVSGVLMLYLGQFVMAWLLTGLPEVSAVIRLFLPSFTLLTLALMLRTVQVLMRRAVELQEETALTI